MTDEGKRHQRLALFLIVGVCAVGVGVLIYRDYGRSPPVPAPGPALVPRPEAEEEVRTAVRVRVKACNRQGGGRTGMTGEIVNTGTMDLHYVTVRAIWKNSAGLEIGTEEFYAMSGGELPPGESRAFLHSTTRPSAARCNAEAVDWW